jgi:hypothetical protein
MGPWHWRMERSDSTVVEPPRELAVDGFAQQGDAESWVGEYWPALLEHGIDAVTLLEGDRVVYGPMSLHAP